LLELKTTARAWARGNQIVDPPSELSLFIMCREFNCLPYSGGWYDQDPDICNSFSVIYNVISEEENKKAKNKK
jgi:hypothetical protein